MILFKKGKFIGGDLMHIIHFDFDDSIEYWWDYPLIDETFILRISRDSNSIEFFNAVGNGIYFIPRREEKESDNWECFWNSHNTVVFESEEQGLQFMMNYKGKGEDGLQGIINAVREELYGRGEK